MATRESEFLRFLLIANDKQAKALLKLGTRQQLEGVAEVCFNLLHGQIDPQVLKDLKRYRHLVRRLADKKLSVASRRKIATAKSKGVVEILRLSEKILP